MNLITLDFETYWSQDYTLTKLSTEDYITDPRFEVILVGVKVNGGEKVWFSGTEAQVKEWLEQFDIPHNALLCHHAAFDGLVLAIRFGIIAAFYCDTRLLAQAQLKPYLKSVRLETCLLHLDLGVQKGDTVKEMRGRTRLSLSKQELAKYAHYCLDDVEGTYRLFRYLAPQFPRSELEIIDITLRMYLCPVLELDWTLLCELLQETKARKAQALAMAGTLTVDQFMSNLKFADVLRNMGIEPPTKISLTTGKETYAFSKTDTAWKELEDEWADDPMVSAILAARLSAKSTIEETRYERLIAACRHPAYRVALLYYAAHTGRYGGTERMNPQNFPRIDKSRMRFAIRAPKDHVVIGADLSQIEARLTAYIARQLDLLQAFAAGVDVYSGFATDAFRTPTVKGASKADDLRRFVGKTCILGLGFGMGAPKLRATLRKDGLKFTLLECEGFVNTYRQKYWNIPQLWRAFDHALEIMASGGMQRVGPITLAHNSIILPNGMALIYHNLRIRQTEKGTQWIYDYAGEVRTLWGGKVVENVVQALARILVMEYMLRIKHTLGLIPALQVHDELDYVVHVRYAERVKLALGKIMSVPPEWAPDLPVAVDVHYGPTFGDCK